MQRAKADDQNLNERSMPKIEASGRHILKNRRMVAESPVKGLSSKKIKQELIPHGNEDEDDNNNDNVMSSKTKL